MVLKNGPGFFWRETNGLEIAALLVGGFSLRDSLTLRRVRARPWATSSITYRRIRAFRCNFKRLSIGLTDLDSDFGQAHFFGTPRSRNFTRHFVPTTARQPPPARSVQHRHP
jgi:hypothetical protein